MNIAQVILSLPFKTRNADEFVDENVLSLFVDPTDGVAGPFDYRNVLYDRYEAFGIDRVG